ncbi:MAG: hypothetical protein PQJ60_12375, partial [Spirochaetales bacterium]|nr:hypothetical protein [Spirochaetales bacterium]
GKFLVKGLFDGEHFFIIKDNGDGTLSFTQGEKFSGLLVGLLASTLKNTGEGFHLMNEALKKRCESV